MLDFVLNFHSGWRFLVLLGAVVMFGYFVYALVTNGTDAKRDKLVATIFGIIVDIQLTLGILLFILYIFDDAREVKGQQIGHAVTMLLFVAPLAHFYSVYSKRNPDADPKRRHMVGAAVPVVALIFIIGGILALGGGFDLVFSMSGS